MYSQYTWLYLIKVKSEVFRVFVEFKAQVELFLSNKIKILQTDNGGDFRAIESMLKQFGITIKRS